MAERLVHTEGSVKEPLRSRCMTCSLDDTHEGTSGCGKEGVIKRGEEYSKQGND